MIEHHDHLEDDFLSDYLRGELSGEAEATVEAHIGSCLVCARRLQAEAELETLLYEAAESPAASVHALQPRPSMWRNVVIGAVATGAMAAAMVMMLGGPSRLFDQPTTGDATVVAAARDLSAFVNDSELCFPSAVEEAEVCVEPLAVAMTTDPDDYLSPYDGERVESSEPRGSGLNACEIEDDLTCEPVAG